MNKKAKNSPFTKNTVLPNDSNYVSNKEMSIVEAKKLLPDSLKHLDLNLKEYKFLAVYCSNGFNAENAVEIAGYKGRTKAQYKAIAYSLLQRKEIVEAIKIYINIVIQPYKDRLEIELLNTYYKRATYTIDKFYDNQGNPLPLKEVDKEFLCCIDDIKYVKITGTQTILPAYQLPNRDLALQALYRFITGQDITNSSILPEEAQKKLKIIYNNVIKVNNIKPKNIKKKTIKS